MSIPKSILNSDDDVNLTDEKKEKQFVHDVYEAIAPHFSKTRYKPWPVVEAFLKQLPSGSIGADVGCGNGKYLSSNLIAICGSKGFEVMICDALNLPYRPDSFDFVISIAVIHHFSSIERRNMAIMELFRIAKPDAQILIYVWALEQSSSSRRQFDQDHQDVFVPWAMPVQMNKPDDNIDDNPNEKKKDIVYNRYYHLFRKNELDDLIIGTGLADIVKSGYDKDNWYVIAKKKRITH
ncbi:2890_t:CDS:2 [Ambispora leptoticha]|uniref:2890_t:CDS:1 n=1 Tax=Ambispora leptoticha TaxID=144679 RepID=A0A9N8V565_9GLOM|nr:2890_t:CDS:2 [Ambispora leptoticha]